MRRIWKMIGGLGLAAGLTAPAFATPAGVWELEGRDTRFAIELCGDGGELCGTLIWLKDVNYNKQYQKYLNKPLVRNAEPAGANRWRGELNIYGHKAAGTITQQSEDRMTLQGCIMLVVCKTYKMHRYTD